MTRPVPDGRRKPILPPTPSSGSGERDGEREREGGRVSIDATPRRLSRSASGPLHVDVATKPTPESGPFIKSGGFFGESVSVSSICCCVFTMSLMLCLFDISALEL